MQADQLRKALRELNALRDMAVCGAFLFVTVEAFIDGQVGSAF